MQCISWMEAQVEGEEVGEEEDGEEEAKIGRSGDEEKERVEEGEGKVESKGTEERDQEKGTRGGVGGTERGERESTRLRGETANSRKGERTHRRGGLVCPSGRVGGGEEKIRHEQGELARITRYT